MSDTTSPVEIATLVEGVTQIAQQGRDERILAAVVAVGERQRPFEHLSGVVVGEGVERLGGGAAGGPECSLEEPGAVGREEVMSDRCGRPVDRNGRIGDTDVEPRAARSSQSAGGGLGDETVAEPHCRRRRRLPKDRRIQGSVDHVDDLAFGEVEDLEEQRGVDLAANQGHGADDLLGCVAELIETGCKELGGRELVAGHAVAGERQYEEGVATTALGDRRDLVGRHLTGQEVAELVDVEWLEGQVGCGNGRRCSGERIGEQGIGVRPDVAVGDYHEDRCVGEGLDERGEEPRRIGRGGMHVVENEHRGFGFRGAPEHAPERGREDAEVIGPVGRSARVDAKASGDVRNEVAEYRAVVASGAGQDPGREVVEQ